MLYLFLAFIFALDFVYSDPKESRLIEDLFKNYHDLERPVREPKLPVKVKLGFQLVQIVDLDEKNQTLDTIAYLLYSWNDYNLKWDPQEYGNITSINMPIDKIWRPDVLLYNSGSTDFDSSFKSMAQIDHNGSVFWNPPAIMKSTCDIDVRYFPFDEQICWLKFGSWTYNGLKLDLDVDESGLDTHLFIPNGEWLLQEVSCNRSTKFYTCCPDEPYYDVKFYLHLRRRTLFIGMNIIVPSLLISVLASFTFVLPVDAGEKVALETTVMMSLIYCLEIVAEMTPVTSDSLPLLSMFYMSCIILIGISCVFAVLVIISHTANPDTQVHMNTTLLSLLNSFVTRALGKERPASRFDRKVMRGQLKGVQGRLRRLSKLTDFTDDLAWMNNPLITADNDENRRNMTAIDTGIFFGETKSAQTYCEETARIFRNITHFTEYISLYVKKMDKKTKFVNDWQYAATVVDRICLILFLVSFTSFTCCIIFSAKYVVA